MIRAIALDDEPPALRIITNFCSQLDAIQLEKTFTRTEEAIAYLDEHPVGLLFLDINMPSISGIELYKKLQGSYMVIFTTAYTDYAIEAFNLKAIDYLLKPFTFDRFTQAVEKAVEYDEFIHAGKAPRQQYLLLKVDYSTVKIDFDDILFAEGLDDYIRIHLREQKPIVVRLTMKSLLEKLSPERFIRVHRSYIVSLQHVEKLRNKVLLVSGQEIPLGNSYEAAFLAKFNR